MVGDAGVEVQRLDAFIDDGPDVAAGEHAADFAFVVGAGAEAAFGGGFGELGIGAGIGERVGKGVARIERGHHAAAMFVGIAVAEFRAIDELGLEDERFGELGEGGLAVEFSHEGKEDGDVFLEFFGGRLTLENLIEELLHDIGEEGIVGGGHGVALCL